MSIKIIDNFQVNAWNTNMDSKFISIKNTLLCMSVSSSHAGVINIIDPEV